MCVYTSKDNLWQKGNINSYRENILKYLINPMQAFTIINLFYMQIVYITLSLQIFQAKSQLVSSFFNNIDNWFVRTWNTCLENRDLETRVSQKKVLYFFISLIKTWQQLIFRVLINQIMVCLIFSFEYIQDLYASLLYRMALF